MNTNTTQTESNDAPCCPLRAMPTSLRRPALLTVLGSVMLIWILLMIHGAGVVWALVSAVLAGVMILAILSFSILTARYMVEQAQRPDQTPFTTDSATEPSLDEMLSIQAEQDESKIDLPAWFEQPYPDPDEELGLTEKELQTVPETRNVPPDMDQA